jgi:AraC-like DNA-binding protein
MPLVNGEKMAGDAWIVIAISCQVIMISCQSKEDEMPAQVRAALLSDLPALALECGFDLPAQLRAAGLEAGVVHTPQLFIPADRVALLLEAAARESGCQDLGLRLAARRQITHLGVSSLVVSQQRTARDALAMTEQYRHLLNEALYVAVEERAGLAIVRCGLALAEADALRQITELAVAAVVQLFRWIIGEQWRPEQVAFVHDPSADTRMHRRYFGCRVGFGDTYNGFTCPSADLDRDNPAAQTALADQARSLLDALPPPAGSDPLDQLHRTLILLMPLGRASIRNCASAMGTSVRSLQRMIEARGTSFSAVLDGLRYDMACRALARSQASIERISESLGYAHASAFVHWFRGKSGLPPAQWRASMADDASG